ncbi:hypothetical protein [Pedobacter sp. UC225_65]|uniref:hypothetical protein n=1 Tax=Pedobacter sp. UC225_65 TaxID=3350173 RepID=UPI00366BC69B
MLKLIVLPVCCSFLLMMSTCKKKNSDEKRVKDGPTLDIGSALAEIGQTHNDTVGITLSPHARYFFIDLGLKNSAENIKLIKSANKLGIPVRAKVFEDNPYEIAKIYAATAEDIEKYRKARINTN